MLATVNAGDAYSHPPLLTRTDCYNLSHHRNPVTQVMAKFLHQSLWPKNPFLISRMHHAVTGAGSTFSRLKKGWALPIRTPSPPRQITGTEQMLASVAVNAIRPVRSCCDPLPFNHTRPCMGSIRETMMSPPCEARVAVVIIAKRPSVGSYRARSTVGTRIH